MRKPAVSSIVVLLALAITRDGLGAPCCDFYGVSGAAVVSMGGQMSEPVTGTAEFGPGNACALVLDSPGYVAPFRIGCTFVSGGGRNHRVRLQLDLDDAAAWLSSHFNWIDFRETQITVRAARATGSRTAELRLSVVMRGRVDGDVRKRIAARLRLAGTLQPRL